MRIYREILKYLKDYVVDRIILTEFEPDTLTTEWKNYTPVSNTVNITAFDQAVEFENIVANTPLILQMLYVERLDDRATLELDILSSDIIPESSLEIGLCEGFNVNSPKKILTNDEEIPANTLTTVSFSINTSITKRVDNLANIRTIKFNFKLNLDSLVIAKVNAINPEFTFTVEDILEQYDNGYNYVLSGLGVPVLPDSVDLLEATYKATASYLWMKQEGGGAKYGNSKNYAVQLMKLADDTILKYKNKGSIPTNPYRNIREIGGYEWSKIQ